MIDTHIQFVLKHDGLLPDDGLGGCSCETCDALRRYVEEKVHSDRCFKSYSPCQERGSTSYGSMGPSSKRESSI